MGIINKIKNFLTNKENKMRIGEKVKLKRAIGSKPSSSNTNIGRSNYFIVKSPYQCGSDYKAFLIEDIHGNNAGWVYEHEISIESKESILGSIHELEREITTLKEKLEWMETMSVDEFDEDEFKVYKTLKTLEDDNLSMMEKTKLIASLVKQ